MTPFPRPAFSAGLGRLLRLMRKELSESLRDRRTILTLVLMPILLYTILIIGFQKLLMSTKVDQAATIYRVGFAAHHEGEALLTWWRQGKEHLVRRHTLPATKGSGASRSTGPASGAGQQGSGASRSSRPASGARQQGSGAGSQGSGASRSTGPASGAGSQGESTALPEYLEPLPKLEPTDEEDLEEAVQTGKVDIGARFRQTAPIAKGKQANFDCVLIYRKGSSRGREAARYLEMLTADANAQFLTQWLQRGNIQQRGDPIRARVITVPDQTKQQQDMLAVLVPLVLVLMTMTGAVYPAIDLTAGERERGTLEILVAAPIPRLSVLLGKYVAVFTVAMLTAVVNLGAMALTLYVSRVGELLFGTHMSPWVFVQVLGLLLLFAGFFSAVALALTSFARSFKEAQAYLIPLMLLCLVPGVMALLPGWRLDGPLAVLPLINIVLLARDVFEGNVNATVTGIVVATTLVYALAAVALAARIFGTEAVLSSEASSWGDLFRRPNQPQPTAEPTTALLCLALMFPAYFLLTTGLAGIPGLDIEARLRLSAAANVLLFGGFPLLFIWRNRVQPVSGLRLRLPGWQACCAAVLLGLSLWPFVHELILFLRQTGMSTLRDEHLQKVREFLAEARMVSPLLIVAVLAVIPAVLEELFFRGYLLAALLTKGAHPARAILTSAGLFALFHLLVTDALAVERLPPSLLLGIVLAWLCYRSGSVIPGMILHALHNGLLVLMGYYEPELIERGWTQSGEEHLPIALLAGAAVAAGVGLLWVWRLRPASQEDSSGVC